MVSSSLFCCLRTRGSMRARAMSKTDLSNVDGFFQRQNTMETYGNIPIGNVETYGFTIGHFFGIFWCLSYPKTSRWSGEASTQLHSKLLTWVGWRKIMENLLGTIREPAFDTHIGISCRFSIKFTLWFELLRPHTLWTYFGTLPGEPKCRMAFCEQVRLQGCRSCWRKLSKTSSQLSNEYWVWILGCLKCRIHTHHITPLTLGTTTAQRADSGVEKSILQSPCQHDVSPSIAKLVVRIRTASTARDALRLSRISPQRPISTGTCYPCAGMYWAYQSPMQSQADQAE